MSTWVKIMAFSHILCFIVNLFREIFETKLGPVGRLMRLIEVCCIIFYGFFTI